ncbi:MAG: tetratricopeptide repeat protein [Methanoregulaceae archaeon]|nr:tetratricopeptide repeat protein [Methanoregulaceae archaeon]
MQKGVKLAAAAILVLFFFGTALADDVSDMALSWSRNGDLLYGQANYTAALEAYNFSLSLDPYNAIVWDRYGNTLARLGMYSEAIHAFDKAVSLDPYLVEALTGKGDALLETRDFQAAIATFDRILALNPNELHSLVGKGVGLEQTGDANGARKAYEEAIRIADREVRVHPNDAKYDADLWNERGNAQLHLGMYQEALESYDRALAINPKHEDAVRNKNAVLLKLFEVRSAPPGLEPKVPGLRVLTTTKSSLPSSNVIIAISIVLIALAFRRRARY